VRAKLVSTFLASTSAPGSTAPEASSTVPWMTPVVIWVWASAGRASAAATSNTANVTTLVFRQVGIERAMITLLGKETGVSAFE